MDKCRINIAVIEPSDIIYEGLSNILLKSGNQFYFYRLTDPDDLSRSFANVKFNIVIVNPSFLQNKKHEFRKIKKDNPDIQWTGMVYSYFDIGFLDSLDGTFYVTDPTELIIRKINNLVTKCDNSNDRREYLSDRETEVLIALIKGFSHKEIADKLNISIHTVNSHRKNIIEKTGIRSLSGLTIYAITKKIIPLEQISPYVER
jgi:DNA-binding CsgD family transcriptional regulator